MKKQELLINATDGFKYLRYAKYSCIIIVIAVLAVFFYQEAAAGSMEKAFTSSPVVTLGFILAAVNLYVYYGLNDIQQDLINQQNAVYCKSRLIGLAVFEGIFLNAVTIGLSFAAIKRNFNPVQLSKDKVRNQLIDSGKKNRLILDGIILGLFAILYYTIFAVTV